VFPLGMYSVCTVRLSQSIDVPFLMPLARVFAYVALAAWSATFVGFVAGWFPKAGSGRSQPPEAAGPDERAVGDS
jgi:tellurite resistance protein TehA-like permease